MSYFDHPLSRVRKRTGCTTMAPSGKERAASPTPTETGGTMNTAIAVAAKDDALLLKKGTVKVQVPTAFYGERSKFKAYVLQVRLYWWADGMKPTKPVDTREMSIVRDQIIWAAFYLKGEAEMRFRPYLKDRLANGTNTRPKTTEIFRTTENFLSFLSMSYGDLNETRTAELELNRLRQTGTFPEYLAKFTGYAA
jgi:hypothetical protein